jgi:hypothetical protein
MERTYRKTLDGHSPHELKPIQVDERRKLMPLYTDVRARYSCRQSKKSRL